MARHKGLVEIPAREYIQHLQHKNSVLKSMFIILTAITLVVGMMGWFVLHTRYEDAKRQADRINEEAVHTLPEFNEGSIKAINQYRANKKLPTVTNILSEKRDDSDFQLVATWQGCAYNHYWDKGWQKIDCSKMGNFVSEMKTKVETFDLTTKESKTPSPEMLVDLLDQKYSDSADKGKKVAVPAILGASVGQGMVYLVGDGGEKWKVYIFTVQKNTP